MRIPGPGAYTPELQLEKPHSHKPKPFGSSTRRFSDNDPKASQPAVGSYEIDEVFLTIANSIYRLIVFIKKQRNKIGIIWGSQEQYLDPLLIDSLTRNL